MNHLNRCLINKLIIETKIESERNCLQIIKDLNAPNFIYDFDGSISNKRNYRIYQEDENSCRESCRDNSTKLYDLRPLVNFLNQIENAQEILTLFKNQDELKNINKFIRTMKISLVFKDQLENDVDSRMIETFKSFVNRISNVFTITRQYFRYKEITSTEILLPGLLSIVSEYDFEHIQV